MRIDDNVNELSKHNKWNKLLPQNRHCFIKINHEREKRLAFMWGISSLYCVIDDSRRTRQCCFEFLFQSDAMLCSLCQFFCILVWFASSSAGRNTGPTVHLLPDLYSSPWTPQSPHWFDMENVHRTGYLAPFLDPTAKTAWVLPPCSKTDTLLDPQHGCREREILISEGGANTRLVVPSQKVCPLWHH